MSSVPPTALLLRATTTLRLRPSSIHTTTSTRAFAGGFQGPTSRGMGRDGGGRGPGGRHRSPRKGEAG